ncbi:MAG: hypothetical protein K0S34_39 [Bacillales bacterium]|jgi:hypothetical protein|nr:hypothetical protein [Bacillales bacterium]
MRKTSIIKEIKKTEELISNIKNKKLQLINLYTDGDISRDELREYRLGYDNQISELNNNITLLNRELEGCNDENYLLTIREKLKDILKLKELTPKLLSMLVEKITATSDGEVHIKYRFVNPLIAT